MLADVVCGHFRVAQFARALTVRALVLQVRLHFAEDEQRTAANARRRLLRADSLVLMLIGESRRQSTEPARAWQLRAASDVSGILQLNDVRVAMLTRD